MGITVTVTGAQGLARLGRALKEADRADLRKELLQALRRGSKPMVPAARSAAGALLPHRGGLAADIASAKWVVQTRLQGRGAGVRIAGAWSSEGKQHDLSKLDAGILRHPVWGHKEPGRKWVAQAIHPRWFSDAMEALAPEIRDELVKAIDDVSRKLSDSV